MFKAKLVKKPEERLPNPDPLVAPDYMEADCQALRAVAAGHATEDQQKRAMQFVIENICGTYDTPVRRSDMETYVAAGKQRVGQIIVWFLNAAPTKTPLEAISARVRGQKPGE